MSLDGRLVGLDHYDFSDFYLPLVESLNKELAARGINDQLAIGAAGQDFGDEIGRSSVLHSLRSYAACIAVHGIPPDEPDPSAIAMELNDMYMGRMPFGPFPHLINHSDSDGFYIPIDFPEPFKFEAPSLSGDGTFSVDVGSCQALVRELDELNKYLKMPGDLGELCGSARVRQEAQGDAFEEEKWVWAVLRWLAREGASKKLLFEFC